MTSSDLVTMYEFSYGALKRNLTGVSHEESLATPEPGGNNLNWVLGHIVSARGLILTLAGGTPVLTGDDAAPYQRGSTPNSTAKVLDLATLRGLLDDSQQQLVGKLAELSDEELCTPLPDKYRRPPLSGSVADALARLCSHESYHAGQIGLLRRLAGKDGAIR
jgi:uncharacterized damage-inducible protein DinB